MVHYMEENWREFWKGVLAQLPVQLGVIPFGLVFGVLGIASGLTATQTILMSSIIFGGEQARLYLLNFGPPAPLPLLLEDRLQL